MSISDQQTPLVEVSDQQAYKLGITPSELFIRTFLRTDDVTDEPQDDMRKRCNECGRILPRRAYRATCATCRKPAHKRVHMRAIYKANMSGFTRYATMSREEWREEYNRLPSREARVRFLDEKAKLLGVSKLYIMRFMRREV